MAEMLRVADALRGVDLVEYAQKTQGYELRARDSASGIAVLDHPTLGDRIAVGRAPDGQWVFASVRDYALRGESEPVELAAKRLRECVGRSESKGTLLELAQRADALRRARVEPDVAHPAGKEALNRRMHGIAPAAAVAGPALDEVARRQREFEVANRAIDRRAEPPRTPAKAGMFAAFDLVEYAQRQQGYVLRAADGAAGLAVLEHRELRDRVAMARTPEGRWIYADVRAYSPRAPEEPAERAAVRLRACIEASPSKGEASDFATRVEGLRRSLSREAAVGRGQTVVMTGPVEGTRTGPEPRTLDAKRELGMRHYGLQPVAIEPGGRGRGFDRGR